MHTQAPVDAADVVGVELKADKPRSLWGDAWRDLRRNPIFYISAVLILFLVVISIWPSLLTSTSPYACDITKSKQGPADGHPFGFNTQAATSTPAPSTRRASVVVGVCTTLLAAVFGCLMGGLAGFFGGWWDSILSRIGDIFFGIPILLGGIVFLSVIKGGSIFTVVLLMAILGWPQIARIARGSVITAKQQDYVQAARALGASTSRMLLRHITPNALAPVIVVATIALGTYVSLEATLSFLASA